MAKHIQLTKGLFATVDDDDYETLNQWKWHASSHGHKWYALRGARSNRVRMHRFIVNAENGMDVDHINGNTLDNRKSNLRICTHAENTRNRRGRSTNRSGYKGVYWCEEKQNWTVEVILNGKRAFRKQFKNLLDAVKAHDDAVKKGNNILDAQRSKR
jgi:hypothetical protein